MELWRQWRQCGGDKSGKSNDKRGNKIANKCESKNLVRCGCSHDEENKIREKRHGEWWRQRLVAALAEAK